jgi:hypothetical protein
MKKIFIKFNKVTTDFANGWTASIAPAHGKPNGINSIAMGESEVFKTKDEAWKSIEKGANKLDFENDNITLNLVKVTSLEDVMKIVSEM